MIRTEEWWPRVQGPLKGGAWGYGLVGLHKKGTLSGQLFAISRS